MAIIAVGAASVALAVVGLSAGVSRQSSAPASLECQHSYASRQHPIDGLFHKTYTPCALLLYCALLL